MPNFALEPLLNVIIFQSFCLLVLQVLGPFTFYHLLGSEYSKEMQSLAFTMLLRFFVGPAMVLFLLSAWILVGLVMLLKGLTFREATSLFRSLGDE